MAQEKLGIWILPIIGAALKKLRDDAHEAAFSADSSQIAFLDQDRTTIWVMAADGSQAKPIIKADPGYRFYAPTWFANDKRLFYVKWRNANGNTEYAMESRNLQGGDPVVMIAGNNLTGGTLNQPGRLVYARSEPPPNERDSNLWELRYDVEPGKPQGEPRQLTQWTGFTFESLSMTGDGNHFVFLNNRQQSAVYFGELADGGNTLKSPQRLTLNENFNTPSAWSPDGKTIFFYSNRDGNNSIYKQGLTDRSAQPVATGPEEKMSPQISPDGNWTIYQQWHKSADATLSAGKLMRAPIAGGAPEKIADFEGGSSGTLTVAFPSVHCPRTGAVCVLAEKRDQDVIFSTFDPLKGQKTAVAKYPYSDLIAGWDLSPDGKRIAVVEFNYQKGEVNLLPLDGAAPQKISTAPWTELAGVSWAADGKSLFLASYSSRGTSLVHFDFAGHSQLLYKPSWDIFTLQASPDGKYLAFGPTIYNSNAWSMGYFPAK